MLNTLIVNEFEGRPQYRRKPKFWELDRKGKLIESKAKQNQFDGKVIAERERENWFVPNQRSWDHHTERGEELCDCHDCQDLELWNFHDRDQELWNLVWNFWVLREQERDRDCEVCDVS